MEAGYYDSVTISTDITSLTGTITYTHHQCSNTTAGLTYTDTTTSASGAASISEITVNGQTAATTQGGCFTTPYYHYTTTTTTACTKNGGYTYYTVSDSSHTSSDGNCDAGYTCAARCNVCGGTGRSHGNSPTYADAVNNVSHNSISTTITGYTTDSSQSGIDETYYIKTCGYANGEVISVTITY